VEEWGGQEENKIAEISSLVILAFRTAVVNQRIGGNPDSDLAFPQSTGIDQSDPSAVDAQSSKLVRTLWILVAKFDGIEKWDCQAPFKDL